MQTLQRIFYLGLAYFLSRVILIQSFNNLSNLGDRLGERRLGERSGERRGEPGVTGGEARGDVAETGDPSPEPRDMPHSDEP